MLGIFGLVVSFVKHVDTHQQSEGQNFKLLKSMHGRRIFRSVYLVFCKSDGGFVRATNDFWKMILW